MIKIFSFTLLLLVSSFYSQLKLEVKELNYEQHKFLIPNHYTALEEEKNNRGHILELILTNNSDQRITLALDTTNYALPFTENLKAYYLNYNLVSTPDLDNSLSAYGFIYQSNNFFDRERNSQDLDNTALRKKKIIMDQRDKTILMWAKTNNITSNTAKVYNLYLVNNMIKIEKKSSIKYKIYFNPFLKMPHWYSFQDFYYQLNPKLPFELQFKIICDENLYKFLTFNQRKKYKNLFTGIIESNTLKLYTTHSSIDQRPN